jgi:hypothetical protein
MKMRLVIEVPLATPEGRDPGDFHPNLQYDTQQIDRLLPPEAVVISSEYVTTPEDMKAIFKKLLRLKLESSPLRGFKSADCYSKGDEDAPFFSESYLYNLVGKDDARTVLAYVHSLMKVAGLDPYKVEREVNAEMAAEKKAEDERVERVAKRRAFVAEYAKKKGWAHDDSFIGYKDDQWAEIKKAMKEAGL